MTDRPTDREPRATKRAALADERVKVERLIEASTVWQMRARQLEERIEAPTAGGVDEDPRQVAVVEPSAAPGREELPQGVATPDQATSPVAGWLRQLFGRS